MPNLKKIANDNLILKIISGSHMHGTNTEESDKDYIGVCIPPKDFTLGIYNFEQYEERTNPSDSQKKNTNADNDCTIYSLPKFIKLLYGQNPNVLELLFAPENCIIYSNQLGSKLLSNKHLFLSKKLFPKFAGYANAQRKKLIDKKPIGLRKDVVDKHGYDAKYAMHLIRLLLFGGEFLRTGNLELPTPWKKFLVDIRKGYYQLSFIIDNAVTLERDLKGDYEHSNLPEKLDMKKINKLQVEMLEEHFPRQIC